MRNKTTLNIGDQPFGHDADAIERVKIAEEDDRPIYLWSTDSPLQSMTGDLGRLAQPAGQVSGQISGVAKAGELVSDMAREAEAVLDALTPATRSDN